jgi:hypothetical protein
MLFVLVELYVLGQVIYAPVGADADIPAFPRVLEHLLVLALARPYHGSHQLHARRLGQRQHAVDNLVDRLLLYLLAAFRAVRHADSRP